MEISDIIASLALFLALIVAFFQWRDRGLTKFNLLNDYTKDLLSWHERTVQILMELRINERQKKEAYKTDLALLSALIEQGRFFFPNIDRKDDYGKDKPMAYRGYRNLALDCLVASYNLFSHPISDASLHKAEILQRLFTSIVFETVRPQDRLETIKKLTDKFEYHNKSIEDFLSHEYLSVLAHMWDIPSKK